jgi:DsbC/DsbD-like thiol-disulfide interchange protein
MRILAIAALVLGMTASASAQIYDPLKIVKWSAEAKPAGKGEFDIVFTANVEKGWNIYAQDVAKGGPIPTTITFDKKGGVIKSGTAKETCDHKKVAKDDNFNMVLTKYYDKVTFTQHVKASGASAKGIVEFMTCNSERCLPPAEFEFNVPLSAAAAPATPVKDPKKKSKKEKK